MTGFLIMRPRSELIYLNMRSEDALNTSFHAASSRLNPSKRKVCEEVFFYRYDYSIAYRIDDHRDHFSI